LAKKPISDKDHSKSKKQTPNPFIDPSPSLLISSLPGNSDHPSHVLILNKYPVIPSHFILATKTYKRQTDLLEKWDLAVAYACLKEWEKDDGQDEEQGPAQDGETTMQTRTKRKLFAFFNSGPHSGASQPHRHLQFLPVEEMTSSSDPDVGSSPSGPGEDWSILADTLTPRQGVHHILPFRVFTAILPSILGLSVEHLHQIYLGLYEQAVEACAAYADAHPEERDSLFYSSDENREGRDAGVAVNESTGTATKISYNLALTTTSIILCPRRSEGCRLWEDGTKGEVEKIIGEGDFVLNGTILAGSLMVKTEKEWDELRKRPRKLVGVLEAIGIPLQGNQNQDSVESHTAGSTRL
jgi:sulfate adenylyltransferase (ADP) / ATP adenylyltransferase